MVERNVAPSTQNLALTSLVFLFREVLKVSTENLSFSHAKRAPRIPVVLSRQEVKDLLENMAGVSGLMTGLIYGTGMRLMECVRLRVMDIDFSYRHIVVKDAKGAKDRIVPLPNKYTEVLQTYLQHVRQQHNADLETGFGRVYLPYVLEKNTPMLPPSRPGSLYFPAADCRLIRILI